MKPNRQVSPRFIGKALAYIMAIPEVRQVAVYVSPTAIVKATRQFRSRVDHARETFIVTIGAPAHRQRLFIKACQKAGTPFPVKKPQIRYWPKQRK